MSNSTSDPPSNFSLEDCSLPIDHGIALISTNAIVGVFGTFGNLLVCVAVATNPRLRRPSNFLLFSLAIADLLVTMVCEPFVVASLAKRTFQNLCAESVEFAYWEIINFSASASVVHMSVISVDRLLAVVWPLRHKSMMGNFGLKPMLGVSWILPFSFFILRKFIQAPPQVKAFLNLAVLIICYATVFVSYSAIVLSLIRQRKLTEKIRVRSPNDAHFRREIRVAFTLAIVIIVFTVCWFPLFVVFAAAGRSLVKVHGVAQMWIKTLALSNSAINFLIYGARIRNFSSTYVDIFKKILKFFGTKNHQVTVCVS